MPVNTTLGGILHLAGLSSVWWGKKDIYLEIGLLSFHVISEFIWFVAWNMSLLGQGNLYGVKEDRAEFKRLIAYPLYNSVGEKLKLDWSLFGIHWICRQTVLGLRAPRPLRLSKRGERPGSRQQCCKWKLSKHTAMTATDRNRIDKNW